MKIRIGFSSCPNDTYIFDALVHQKINTEAIRYEPFIADVEALNQMALQGDLEVTKLSYHAYGHVSQLYQILDAGSALGFGNGPLLVKKQGTNPPPVEEARIGIPGQLTTANFLLKLAYPAIQQSESILFSIIEDLLLDNQIDYGVLIHEKRFSYAENGLALIKDLGQFWEKMTGLPIPLGGIAVRRDLSYEIKQTVQRHVRESLLLARKHPEATMDYMLSHAQDMRRDILLKHVATFVNDFSLSLGHKGHATIRRLLDYGYQHQIFTHQPEDLFIPLVN